MTTRADWIRVELTTEDVLSAERRGSAQQEYARRRGFRRDGFSSLRTAIQGALGELAVARYLACELDPDWTWEGDIRRRYDVGGYGVRTGHSAQTPAHLALALHADDRGQFIRASAHDRPVMWLIGQIDAKEGLVRAVRRKDGTEGRRGAVWYQVAPKHLEPLPPQNGYGPWCQLWGSLHPVIDHDCRRQRPAATAHASSAR